MDKKSGIAILLIPGFGILALFVWIFQTFGAEAASPLLGGAVKLGAAIGFPLLGFVFIRSRRSQAPRSAIRTRVIGARSPEEGRGELTVEARHSSAVSALRLPMDAKITTVTPNRLYSVTFQASKWETGEVARNNGYSGLIG